MFESIPEAVAALAAGEVIVLTDDESRENEGDLICAGIHATPGNVNFMVSYGRGVLCVPVDDGIAARLQLHIPAGKHDPRGTAFSQSLDAVSGTTTGVSAFDRAETIRRILDSNSRLDDFYSPGHVYPLLARAGGVLERAGHTEGVIDLLKLGNLPPVGVLCEILNDDGTMARMPDLEKFCSRHKLKHCTIAALQAYLRNHSK